MPAIIIVTLVCKSPYNYYKNKKTGMQRNLPTTATFSINGLLETSNNLIVIKCNLYFLSLSLSLSIYLSLSLSVSICLPIYLFIISIFFLFSIVVFQFGYQSINQSCEALNVAPTSNYSFLENIVIHVC